MNNVKKLGFGAMRLPITDENNQKSIDYEQASKMVDAFMDAGYNYFDTAYPYHLGGSEEFLKEALVKKYPRDSFYLADKMPLFFIEKEEDLARIFNEQLERCGVDYFDYYLLHNVSNWTKKAFTEIDSFGYMKQLKREGKIKHLGISYHDDAEFLEEVLNEHPEIEFVQLQINYLDWENESIQAKECYELAVSHNLPIIIMEPLKGGSVVNIPQEAKDEIDKFDGDVSPVSLGLRYAGSLDGVLTVLCGMSVYEECIEDIEIMNEFKPINNDEKALIEKLATIINDSIGIPCTQCNYCAEVCENSIPIPVYFQLYNDEELLSYRDFSTPQIYYRTYALTDGVGKASDCDYCGDCIEKCPQHLEIPDLLEDVYEKLEKTMYEL